MPYPVTATDHGSTLEKSVADAARSGAAAMLSTPFHGKKCEDEMLPGLNP